MIKLCILWLLFYLCPVPVHQNYTEPFLWRASKGSQPREKMYLGETFSHKSKLWHWACSWWVCCDSQSYEKTKENCWESCFCLSWFVQHCQVQCFKKNSFVELHCTREFDRLPWGPYWCCLLIASRHRQFQQSQWQNLEDPPWHTWWKWQWLWKCWFAFLDKNWRAFDENYFSKYVRWFSPKLRGWYGS